MNKIILEGKWDMDYIGKVLSDLLSKQYDTEIIVKFTPKEKKRIIKPYWIWRKKIEK